MSKEKILNPKYKVVAGWPGANLPVGLIIQFEEIYPYSGYSYDFNGVIISPEYCDSYPHLFKKVDESTTQELSDSDIEVMAEKEFPDVFYNGVLVWKNDTLQNRRGWIKGFKAGRKQPTPTTYPNEKVVGVKFEDRKDTLETNY